MHFTNSSSKFYLMILFDLSNNYLVFYNLKKSSNSKKGSPLFFKISEYLLKFLKLSRNLYTTVNITFRFNKFILSYK